MVMIRTSCVPTTEQRQFFSLTHEAHSTIVATPKRSNNFFIVYDNISKCKITNIFGHSNYFLLIAGIIAAGYGPAEHESVADGEEDVLHPRVFGDAAVELLDDARGLVAAQPAVG